MSGSQQLRGEGAGQKGRVDIKPAFRRQPVIPEIVRGHRRDRAGKKACERLLPEMPVEIVGGGLAIKELVLSGEHARPFALPAADLWRAVGLMPVLNDHTHGQRCTLISPSFLRCRTGAA